MQSLEQIQEIVSKSLDQFNKRNGKSGIYTPISYILSLGGKRLRPALSVMSCQLFSDDIEDAIHPALAIEVFHNFTLMHDDIMDNAPLRRGKATVHEKWNASTAILSGDAMMILAYEELAKTNATVFSDIFKVFNKTALEVCEGQQMDMDFENRADVTLNEYIEMIRLKTSVLLAGAMQIGAHIGGADKKNRDLIYEFGENTGIAFQLLDDYLDAFGEQSKVGKITGGDIIADKKTYLQILALQQAKDTDAEVLKYWLGKKPKDPTEKVKAVMSIFEKLNIGDQLLETVQHYHQRALYALKQVSVEEDRKRDLYALAEQMLSRQH
ncbi:MAG: polyprenyl synthetase family protein [Flavobacteriales bacterium]